MSAPLDPTLARLGEFMAAAHRLALDATLAARTAGIREGINAAADIIAAATQAANTPPEFAGTIQSICDQIRLLAHELSDPEPIQ